MIYTLTHTLSHTYTHARARVYAITQIYTHIHTLTHTYTHLHTLTHTYTRTRARKHAQVFLTHIFCFYTSSNADEHLWPHRLGAHPATQLRTEEWLLETSSSSSITRHFPWSSCVALHARQLLVRDGTAKSHSATVETAIDAASTRCEYVCWNENDVSLPVWLIVSYVICKRLDVSSSYSMFFGASVPC